MLPLFILVPLAAMILVNLPVVSRLGRSCAAGLVVLLALAQVAAAVLWPDWLSESGGGLANFLTLNFAPGDFNLSRVLLLSIGIVTFVATLVGGSMMGEPRRRFQFASVLLIAMTGMNGVVLSGDLFSLYVFLEVTTVCSFVLIAFHRGLSALEGAFKYIMLSAVATTLMLGAIALFMMMSGGTSFAAVQKTMADSGSQMLARIAMGAFLCGLLVKGGLVPFHGWLPAAYSTAPAPVSVLLAGIVTKVSGIYALIRVFGVFNDLGVGILGAFAPGSAISQVLLLVGAISIVVGALAAIGQKDLKRMLAYSSISQVGYIVLGLGGGTALSIAGAIFHLFNHSIFKSLLFVNSAAVEQQTGTTDMTRLGGLSTKMPVTGVTNVIGFLSTAGVPPLAGFWSKLLIVVGLWNAGLQGYAFLAVLFSVVTLGYLLIMQRRIFFGQLREGLSAVHEASPGVVVSMVVLAALTIGVGLLAPYLFSTFLLPVQGILPVIGGR
jgi:proton-translocating NADH-quinone oxidoreductase chain N